jgi:hypothetical protein
MNAAEFANLQEALMWVLGPMAMWIITLILAGAIMAAIMIPFMALFRRLSR